MRPMESTWAETTLASIRARGHRQSAARRAVVDLLGRQNCCLTAQEIFDELRGSGRRVGIASIYRILEQLVRDGFVQRIDVGDGIARYEPTHTSGEHHHHLVCDECGRLVAFEDHPLEQALEGLSTRLGHDVAGHDVVLRGECSDCLAGPS
jgi:Fur family ferric uptake transcriptional regulator